jgi:hypothetical protein
MNQLRIGMAFALGAVLLVGTDASAEKRLTARMKLPAFFNAKVTADGCMNHPGPYIAFDGLAGAHLPRGRLIFANNVKLTRSVLRDAVIHEVSFGDVFGGRVFKGGSTGPAGNPYVFVRPVNGVGAYELADEVLLGRCVQGLSPYATEFLLDSDVSVDVTAGDCSNHPGPWVTLGGEIRIGGFDVIVRLANKLGPTKHSVSDDTEVSFLIWGDNIAPIPKGGRYGAGGQPHIFFQWLRHDGATYGEPIYLGRCKDI